MKKFFLIIFLIALNNYSYSQWEGVYVLDEPSLDPYHPPINHILQILKSGNKYLGIYSVDGGQIGQKYGCEIEAVDNDVDVIFNYIINNFPSSSNKKGDILFKLSRNGNQFNVVWKSENTLFNDSEELFFTKQVSIKDELESAIISNDPKKLTDHFFKWDYQTGFDEGKLKTIFYYNGSDTEDLTPSIFVVYLNNELTAVAYNGEKFLDQYETFQTTEFPYISFLKSIDDADKLLIKEYLLRVYNSE